ncbi:hypothetical protein FQR65_LT12567 [Abscondita terminalis]|nr:hypothetical protein FQR65_LT12567 [Abscondita terminalis]
MVFWCLVLTKADLVNYYEDLIETGFNNAAKYDAPNDASAYRPVNNVPLDYGTYEFVIVGAGAAGAVVANRLSENPSWRILLLEAGKKGNDLTAVPALNFLSASSEYDWGYKSLPQTECCQQSDGACPFLRGKALGGSTILNAQVYERGIKADYDKWASFYNPEWSYDKVLPYFMKSLLGSGGYLNAEHHIPLSPKVQVFLDAHQELERLNVARITNFTTLNGRRQTTDDIFLKPARRRRNLRILTETYVDKVVINRRLKSATGVLFSHNRTKYFVKITKEVVLSAGVIGSVYILMHSGIGPKQHLRDLNIDVLKNLPVGYNMHDHISLSSIKFSTRVPDKLYTLKESIEQYLNGTGPLTNVYNVQGVSYLHLSSNDSNAPDFELLFSPLEINFRAKSNESYVSQFHLVLLHPKTRERVYLKSNDPYVYPLIDSKCFRDDRNEDAAMFRRGIDTVLEIIETEAFKEIGAELLPDPLCAMHEFKTEEYWSCSIIKSAVNIFHAAGTCAMGAVVDGNLNVYGVKRLRVADASVVPVTISGHMTATAIMTPEKEMELEIQGSGMEHAKEEDDLGDE